MEPMFLLVRIRDIAAHAWVIVDEHAAYAEGYSVMDALDDGASAPTLRKAGSLSDRYVSCDQEGGQTWLAS